MSYPFHSNNPNFLVQSALHNGSRTQDFYQHGQHNIMQAAAMSFTVFWSSDLYFHLYPESQPCGHEGSNSHIRDEIFSVIGSASKQMLLASNSVYLELFEENLWLKAELEAKRYGMSEYMQVFYTDIMFFLGRFTHIQNKIASSTFPLIYLLVLPLCCQHPWASSLSQTLHHHVTGMIFQMSAGGYAQDGLPTLRNKGKRDTQTLSCSLSQMKMVLRFWINGWKLFWRWHDFYGFLFTQDEKIQLIGGPRQSLPVISSAILCIFNLMNFSGARVTGKWRPLQQFNILIGKAIKIQEHL